MYSIIVLQVSMAKDVHVIVAVPFVMFIKHYSKACVINLECNTFVIPLLKDTQGHLCVCDERL